MVLPFRGMAPWSTDRSGHYQRAVEVVKGLPGCLEGATLLEYKLFYRQWRDAAMEYMAGGRPWSHIYWAGLQLKWLDGASRDLHWLGALASGCTATVGWEHTYAWWGAKGKRPWNTP